MKFRFFRELCGGSPPPLTKGDEGTVFFTERQIFNGFEFGLIAKLLARLKAGSSDIAIKDIQTQILNLAKSFRKQFPGLKCIPANHLNVSSIYRFRIALFGQSVPQRPPNQSASCGLLGLILLTGKPVRRRFQSPLSEDRLLSLSAPSVLLG